MNSLHCSVLTAFFTTVMISSLYGCASGGIQTSTGEEATDIIAVFEKGDARLNCELSCATTWGRARRHARVLYNLELWSDLATEVSRVGYKNDLTYFYLGRAAEGLGKTEASRTYYKLALATTLKCDSVIDACDGIEVPKLLSTFLKRTEQKQNSITQNSNSYPEKIQASTDISLTAKNPDTANPSSQKSNHETSNETTSSEIPPITISMWRAMLPTNKNELTSEWLFKKIDNLTIKSQSLAAAKKNSEWLLLSLQVSILSEYYIELQDYYDKDQLIAINEKGKAILSKFGIPKSFYVESFKNLKIAIPEGTIKSSTAVTGSVFGHPLGKPFYVPECQKNTIGYSITSTKTCFEYDAKNNTDLSRINGYVKINPTYDERPDIIYGLYYYALIINGRLEGVLFETGGIKYMNYVYEKLQNKYGEPNNKKIRTVKNLYGATFDVTDAHWSKDNTTVSFTGVKSSLDEGSVKILTTNGRIYTHENSKKTRRENPL